jgi:hypothetical protein
MRCDFYRPDQLRKIAKYPHLIGHLVGKTKLTPMHSDWIHSLWDAPRHTSLQAHRGAYKTTALTEIGVIRRLLLNPDNRIALIRETWSTANDTLKTIGLYMQQETIQELFRAFHGYYPETITSRDGRITWNFKGSITKEGSLDAYGVDTVPTGSHYDDILVDDAITINDRFSRAKRERTRANLQEIMTNILDPGRFLRAVGTPWHKEDAWEILPKPMKYDVFSTGILTPDQIEDKRLSMTSSMWAANYLLEHVNGDNLMFTDPRMEKWETNKLRKVAHLDAAYGGRDTTALTIASRRGDGCVQMWVRVWAGAAESHLSAIRWELEHRGCHELYMEDNGDHGMLARVFEYFGEAKWLSTENYHETQNKHKKIHNYLGHFWRKIVWAMDSDPEAMAQICDYVQDAAPDDAPDSAASLLREVFFEEETDIDRTLFS